jgi:Flp pilus assembly protein TadG
VVNFAIALPLLLLVIFGFLMLSWLVTDSVQLARAAGAGAMFFANQAKSPMAFADTQRLVRDAAPHLGNNLTISATVAARPAPTPPAQPVVAPSSRGRAARLP